jgi:hypothetical protein
MTYPGPVITKISSYLPRAGVLGVKKSEVDDVGKRKAAAQR